MSVPTFTKSGTKATTVAKLDKTVFGLEVKNHELLKQAYLAYQANGRQNLAVVKTRGEVRGGGRKPWKQKGTGRARFGSSRNPIWRGGGITFGPTGNENYSHKMSTKSKRQAIRQALTLKNDQISIIESYSALTGKTTDATKLLQKIGAGYNTLIVCHKKSTELSRSLNNLDKLILVSSKYLNVFDILNARHIIIEQKSLQDITEWLSPGADKKVEATA